MRPLIVFLYCMLGILAASLPSSAAPVQEPAPCAYTALPREQLPPPARLDLDSLMEAYPGVFTGMGRSAAGLVLIATDGRTVVYDDGRVKTQEQLYTDADVEDSMRTPYPLEPSRPALGPDDDPGRIRSYPLLGLLYGSTRHGVQEVLCPVTLGTKHIRVNQRITEPLRQMQTELLPILAAHPELKKHFSDVDCFCWRVVAKTNHLSPHSYAIAIDLAPALNPYWQWIKLMPHPLQKTWPTELVALFERHGFIWGGKWRHYDLMHIEYRPELIIKARKQSPAAPSPQL